MTCGSGTEGHRKPGMGSDSKAWKPEKQFRNIAKTFMPNFCIMVAMAHPAMVMTLTSMIHKPDTSPCPVILNP